MASRVIRRLAELLDVTVSAPADGEVLTYDSGTSKFRNEAAGAGSSPISMATITLSAADLLGLTLTNGVTVVAAPGANTAVVPMPGGTALYTAGATPFTVTNLAFAELFFAHDGAVTSTAQLGTQDWYFMGCADVLTSASSLLSPIYPEQRPAGNGFPTGVALPRAGIVNKALKVYFASIPDGDSLAAGNGTLTLKLPYYTRAV